MGNPDMCGVEVWRGGLGGAYRLPTLSSVGASLVPAAKKTGIGRVGWHSFRHSHSTLLHALGVDLKVQQGLLRHADVRTTMNIYTQAVPSALREANSKVFRLVGPSASRLALMTPCGPSKSHKLIFMKEMLVGAVGIESSSLQNKS